MGEIALRELGAMQDTVNGLGGAHWATPTALPGWTVDGLVRHVAEVATRQGEAYQRARLAVSEKPSDAPVTASTERLPDALDIASSFLGSAVRDLERTGDPLVPLPFAVLPASTADFVLLVEYGIHRYDLEHALGGSPQLSPDVVDAITGLLGLTLPAIAAPNGEPRPPHITIEPEGRPPICLAWQDGAWTATDEPSAETSTIRGSAEAIALFVFGRRQAGDDLEVEPASRGTEFKTLFPGP